jgi:hypothetical protein
MTEEQFNKIYADALKMCRIKCMNNKRRDAIRQYKVFLKSGDLKYASNAKEQIKKDYWGFECYECSCVPLKKYMFEKIKAVK